MQVLFAVLAIVLMVLAGLGVRHRRFAPEWFGLACAFVAYFWSLFTALD